MKLFAKALVLTFAMALIMPTMGIMDAEAKRFGGGSSFGKQRMISPAQKARPAPQQQATSNKKTGLLSGGLMGGIAGLAMGGLLGAMLFGGAFEGINFFDILLIGGAIFLIMMLLKRRAPQPSPAYAGGGMPYENAHANDQIAARQSSNPSMGGSVVRPDIDAAFFTQAAKDIFVRMQTAWDAKDMDDIRSFCTADVVTYIDDEMRKNEHETSRTQTMTLQAELIDSWCESDKDWAAVHFKALMREETLDANGNPTEQADHEVNETWMFQHDPKSNDPTWYVAGIEQAGA